MNTDMTVLVALIAACGGVLTACGSVLTALGSVLIPVILKFIEGKQQQKATQREQKWAQTRDIRGRAGVLLQRLASLKHWTKKDVALAANSHLSHDVEENDPRVIAACLRHYTSVEARGYGWELAISPYLNAQESEEVVRIRTYLQKIHAPIPENNQTERKEIAQAIQNLTHKVIKEIDPDHA